MLKKFNHIYSHFTSLLLNTSREPSENHSLLLCLHRFRALSMQTISLPRSLSSECIHMLSPPTIFIKDIWIRMLSPHSGRTGSPHVHRLVLPLIDEKACNIKKNLFTIVIQCLITEHQISMDFP